MARKKKYIVYCIVAVILVLTGCVWWGNNALEISTYVVISERISEEFSGFRIAQISDLHNTEFGEGNEKLLSILHQSDPDIIVITGDLVDSRRSNMDIALDFVRSAAAISPVYYVSGNHEARLLEYPYLRAGLELAGAVVLENETVALTHSGAQIVLLGLEDPAFGEDTLVGDAASVAASALTDLQIDTNHYTVLLAHRPDLFDTYAEAGVDLVFSGHAHGGQFRLPLVGGLVAPNQGFFPAYDAGLYKRGNTTMIVSRGLGNSIIPVRINNRPEVVVAELQSSQ